MTPAQRSALYFMARGAELHVHHIRRRLPGERKTPLPYGLLAGYRGTVPLETIKALRDRGYVAFARLGDCAAPADLCEIFGVTELGRVIASLNRCWPDPPRRSRTGR
jgi:hypothetical protein